MESRRKLGMQGREEDPVKWRAARKAANVRNAAADAAAVAGAAAGETVNDGVRDKA